MKVCQYTLAPKSRWISGDSARLVGFDLTVRRDRGPLGGNNIQAAVLAPERELHGSEVALVLRSGWRVSLRNQFADAPAAAIEIIESVGEPLSEITGEISAGVGATDLRLLERLFASSFEAAGPDHWR